MNLRNLFLLQILEHIDTIFQLFSERQAGLLLLPSPFFFGGEVAINPRVHSLGVITCCGHIFVSNPQHGATN